ncbi:MAG: hypothetical protein ACYCY8_13120 [Burkholderiales bacterium]
MARNTLKLQLQLQLALLCALTDKTQQPSRQGKPQGQTTIFRTAKTTGVGPVLCRAAGQLTHFRPTKDFECFLANATAPGMEKEKQLAKNWIEEIHKQLAIAK